MVFTRFYLCYPYDFDATIKGIQLTLIFFIQSAEGLEVIYDSKLNKGHFSVSHVELLVDSSPTSEDLNPSVS